MYKLLIFIHKSKENNFLNFFRNSFLPLLTEIEGNEVKLAEVESNLLLDQKYSYFCELTANNKDEMDRKLNSPAGRSLSKLLMESHQNITVITVNYQS
uniref:Uncharacterized protein n=1 Tax=Ignavibacterium album TaxID=591197 RepID=A0A832DIJ4_9BACT